MCGVDTLLSVYIRVLPNDDACPKCAYALIGRIFDKDIKVVNDVCFDVFFALEEALDFYRIVCSALQDDMDFLCVDTHLTWRQRSDEA